jgi:hypothetical protein
MSEHGCVIADQRKDIVLLQPPDGGIVDTPCQGMDREDLQMLIEDYRGWLERVQLGQALLLFLLAGGLVAQVDLGLLGFAVGGGLGGLSGVLAGLDVVHLVGGLGRLFSGGQNGVGGPTGLTTALGSAAAGRAPHGAIGRAYDFDATPVPPAGACICNGAVEG